LPARVWRKIDERRYLKEAEEIDDDNQPLQDYVEAILQDQPLAIQ
jgi:hypothetical protein